MYELKNKLLSKEISIDSAINDKIEKLSQTHIEITKMQDELSYSAAGRIGRVIEPFVKPLGFDWKIGISAVTGFAAKELVVSTLGVLYKVGTEENEESETLRESLRKDKVFNPLVAFTLMLFTLIITPCFAALAAIRAEIGWKWLVFSIFFNTSLAWLICFIVYQTGKLFFV